MIPLRILNSQAEIFAETNTKGTMGQPVQSLQLTSIQACYCDLKSQQRDDSPIEQTAQTARLYLAGSVNLTTSNWVRVTSRSGRVFTGQVASVSEPGLAAHHTAVNLISRPLPPLVTS